MELMTILEAYIPEKSVVKSSGVASVDDWRGEYSYIHVHRP